MGIRRKGLWTDEGHFRRSGTHIQGTLGMKLRDSSPVWLFDNVCVLCSRSVQFTLRHERNPEINFVSIQSAKGRKLALRNGIDPANPESFLFILDGRALIKSDAIVALARHLKYPARLIAAIRFIPKFIRDPCYDWLARNRYRIFGRRDNCVIPRNETRHRFIL